MHLVFISQDSINTFKFVAINISYLNTLLETWHLDSGLSINDKECFVMFSTHILFFYFKMQVPVVVKLTSQRILITGSG